MVKLTQHLNALDMDGDGKVDMKDFLALFSSGQKEKPALPNLETLVSEAWGRNNKDLDKLSDTIRSKVSASRPLTRKSSFSTADRRMKSILNRLQLDFNDKDLEAIRAAYLDCLINTKKTEENISDLIAKSSLASSIATTAVSGGAPTPPQCPRAPLFTHNLLVPRYLVLT